MKYIVETKGIIGNYNNDIKYKTEKDTNKEFVTQRVAELLRLKKFDEWCWWFYNLIDDDTPDFHYSLERWTECPHRNSEHSDDSMSILSAPTVQAAIDWLETKGYWIVYRPLDYYKGVIVSILAADDVDEWYDVNNITAETKYEGLNNALEFCLEKLIR